ncbi:MAG: hypothetical protein E7307_02400 [Butyrivibrio sp.]|nr:hypothetical protein [Butyrivibrio sp.]
MLEKIIERIEKYTSYDKSKMNRYTTFIGDLDINSLEIMQLVVELEEEYDIELPEERLFAITTLGELEDLLTELLEEN